MYQVKELIQPTDVVFPLAGIAKHVQLISPGEEFVVAEPSASEKAKRPAPPCRAYTGTTRPAHIGRKAGKALQHSERLNIAAREAAKEAERLRESEPPMPTGEDEELLGDGTSSHNATPISEVNSDYNGNCDVAAVERASPRRTAHKQPVIIEYCCDLASMMG